MPVSTAHPLITGDGPAWARGWGEDRSGIFADLRVDHVTQRLRWIPPGWFWMGCPETETGFDGKYDQLPHKEQVRDGFWLFDTPVTQELWKVVMKGKNPSRFQSDDRPVESVTWDEATTFCQTLSKTLPGCAVSLPSEREWEYACRAGTKTATYAGDVRIVGDADVPELDAIAWYAGNAGVDFELQNRVAFPWFEPKQSGDRTGGTHPVKLKRPNAWGLYDMLGNVWEWCTDAWSDPGQLRMSVEAETTAYAAVRRVVRGGSWINKAPSVRSAGRSRSGPSWCSPDLGFRCRVQSCELEGGATRD